MYNVFCFWPVGHGLFYTGTLLKDTAKPLNFVYDCGTMYNPGKGFHLLGGCIDKYVADILRGRPIDFAVISHLHYDHYCGVVELFKKSKIEKLYIPYICDDAYIIKLLLFCESVFGNNIDDENKDTLEENDVKDLFDLICALYNVDIDDNNKYKDLVKATELIQIWADKTEEYIYKKDENPILEESYWKFDFFGKSIDENKLNAFREEVKKIFGGDLDFAAYFTDKSKREITDKFNALKELYKKNLREEMNRTSIIMVHQPIIPMDKVYYTGKPHGVNERNDEPYTDSKKLYCEIKDCEESGLGAILYNYDLCGEIITKDIENLKGTVSVLTGDAVFDDEMLGQLKSLKNTEDNFWVFQIPHHGSDNNWLNVKTVCSDLYGATCRDNDCKHPGKQVIHDMRDKKFFTVTSDDSTFLLYIIKKKCGDDSACCVNA